jgi:hypothetical protein
MTVEMTAALRAGRSDVHWVVQWDLLDWKLVGSLDDW